MQWEEVSRVRRDIGKSRFEETRDDVCYLETWLKEHQAEESDESEAREAELTD